MSKEATAQIHDGKLQTALRLMQSQNKHRVKVFDQWDGSTTDYYIDNIRLEAKSGKASTYYEIDHCSIRKDYTRID